MAQQEINRKAQESYFVPSLDLARFFFLVLDHIHWFAIERFQSRGQTPGPGAFSIWLNHDEFEVGATGPKYKLPVSPG